MTIENATNSANSNPTAEATTPAAPAPVESVADTLKAVFDETYNEGSEGSESALKAPGTEAPSKPSAEISEAARKLSSARRKQTVEGRDLDAPNAVNATDGAAAAPQEAIKAPERWTVEKKEWFNTQPREAQEEMVRGWGDIEGYLTKTSQDLAREKQDTAQTKQILDHYRPKWNLKGMTESQVMAELCATHDLIVNDPLKGCLSVLEGTGISPEDLINYRDGGAGSQALQINGQQSPVQSSPNQPLTEQRLLQILEGQQQQTQQQQQITAATQEFEAVKNETTAEGNYLYPELHDNTKIAQLQPLVEHLRTTQPSISWGEAFKRALQTQRMLLGSPSSQATGLQPANNLDIMKMAASSVTGQGNGTSQELQQAGASESVRDSLLAVRQSLLNNY